MPEFQERPTLRLWKANQRRIRWERRLARAPYYTIACYVVFIVACIALVIVAVKTA